MIVYWFNKRASRTDNVMRFGQHNMAAIHSAFDSALDHCLFVVACGLVALCFPADALAHAPHDEVIAVLISPAYSYDGIVFAIVRFNILRSTDFGYTWHRLTRG